jgi:hypothetical protein
MAIEIGTDGTIRIIPADHRDEAAIRPGALPRAVTAAKDASGADVDWLDCAP